MKRMRARRSFYSDGRIDPRQLIRRGREFETSDTHAHELQLKGIAEPLPEAGPSAVQDVQPEHQQTARPQQQPENRPQNTQTAGPQEHKRPEPAADIENLPYGQLKQLAKEAGIEGYHRMKKEKLIQLLKGES